LAVGGLVGRPLELGINDLKRLPRLERYHTLMCISNEIGDGLIGNASWGGVRLMDVLDLAQVSGDARHVNFLCADGYVESISMDQARATLLAYAMNRGPIEDRHGFPVRALVPGTYGMKNPKWITRIDAAASPEQGFWNKLGWDAGAPLRIFSRIDVPQARVVALGDVVLGGIAFAGNRGISKVEISGDGGQTWSETDLRAPLSANAWVLWATVWRPGRIGDHVLAVRATDGPGTVQSPEIRSPFPSGVSGYHRVTITVEAGKR
ncbi:MAG: molybdopterin-dependent oxidoreductase, partial [bacterium]